MTAGERPSLRAARARIYLDVRTRREQFVAGILDVVGRRAGLAVEPEIGDHAVRGRVSTGGERRVPHDGFCVRMGVIGVGVRDRCITLEAVGIRKRIRGGPLEKQGPQPY